ncbi:MAG: PocR ligand-binding domain-containing protein [Roseibacillus sp.]
MNSTTTHNQKDASTQNEELFQSFSQSKLLKDFAVAFEAATGLPLRLEDANNQVSESIGTTRNSFCQAMQEEALTQSVCEACHHRIRIVATQDAVDCPCYFGLRVHVAPVRANGSPFAYLSTCLFPEHEFQEGLPKAIETTLKNLGAPDSQIKSAQLAYQNAAESPTNKLFESTTKWLDTFCSLAGEKAPSFT